MALKHLVLFDIDGVLADDSHRLQHALDGNWAEYFYLADQDPLLEPGADLARTFAEDPSVEVQYLTGRRIDMYLSTRLWLSRNRLPNPERITMRGFADRDILSHYKAGVLRNAIYGGEFASVSLFEDDPAVVEHINIVFPDRPAYLTTWYVKNPGMVKHAKS